MASEPSSSDVPRFQRRPQGWSAEQVARLGLDDPCLLGDQELATWREVIVSKACKYARRYLNRIFPENTKYAFCKLPQWPTVLPWIARTVAHASKGGSRDGRGAPSALDADSAALLRVTTMDGPHQSRAFDASSSGIVPSLMENNLPSAADSDPLLLKNRSTPLGKSPSQSAQHHP